jgi:drug/metabolite transporter (DMT)-like permease
MAGLAFWRWLFALLLILPLGLPSVITQWDEVRRRWKLLAVLSVTSVSTYNTFLYVALTTTTAVNATLVTTAIPIAVLLLSRLWLGEAISLRQCLGVAVSLSGVVAVIGRGDPAVLAALEWHPGDLWAMGSVLGWAIYSVMLRRYPTDLRPISLLTLQVGIGWLFLWPFYLWELAGGGGFSLTWQAAGLIAYVAIFPSAVAYYFWNQGVAALGPTVASQYTYLVPLFTAGLATLLLGESIRWFHVAGLVLILAGIRLATRRN